MAKGIYDHGVATEKNENEHTQVVLNDLNLNNLSNPFWSSVNRHLPFWSSSVASFDNSASSSPAEKMIRDEVDIW